MLHKLRNSASTFLGAKDSLKKSMAALTTTMKLRPVAIGYAMDKLSRDKASIQSPAAMTTATSPVSTTMEDSNLRK